MGLRDAIPGLKAHETAIPPKVPVVVSFDNEAAQTIIRQAVSDVACSFPPPDPWGWLSQNRPEVVSGLKQVGNDMNAAYLAEDMPRVVACADLFVRAHMKAWHIYETRPPVIERQEALFEGAN